MYSVRCVCKVGCAASRANQTNMTRSTILLFLLITVMLGRGVYSDDTPTVFPTVLPTHEPTPSPTEPTTTPTDSSTSSEPSLTPTHSPTLMPTLAPTHSPTLASLEPSSVPTLAPSQKPSMASTTQASRVRNSYCPYFFPLSLTAIHNPSFPSL